MRTQPLHDPKNPSQVYVCYTCTEGKLLQKNMGKQLPYFHITLQFQIHQLQGIFLPSNHPLIG